MVVYSRNYEYLEKLDTNRPLISTLILKVFELLLILGLLNLTLINSAIFAFKSYENVSLLYNSFIKHQSDKVGLFDAKIFRD